MTPADKQIEDILARFGEPMAGSTWKVQGNTVIFHKTLERIAAKAEITWDPPTIVRAEADEAVILVTGRRIVGSTDAGSVERAEWSIGEARIDVNYRISGRQAAYPYAMAEKRAKDRVILKLIGAHGLLYSEEEADEFRNGRPGSPGVEANESPARGHTAAEAEGSHHTTKGSPVTALNVPFGPTDQEAAAYTKAEIDRHVTVAGVTEYMLTDETKKRLNDMPAALRDECRDHAKARLMALGWTGKKAS